MHSRSFLQQKLLYCTMPYCTALCPDTSVELNRCLKWDLRPGLSTKRDDKLLLMYIKWICVSYYSNVLAHCQAQLSSEIMVHEYYRSICNRYLIQKTINMTQLNVTQLNMTQLNINMTTCYNSMWSACITQLSVQIELNIMFYAKLQCMTNPKQVKLDNFYLVKMALKGVLLCFFNTHQEIFSMNDQTRNNF